MRNAYIRKDNSCINIINAKLISSITGRFLSGASKRNPALMQQILVYIFVSLPKLMRRSGRKCEFKGEQLENKNGERRQTFFLQKKWNVHNSITDSGDGSAGSHQTLSILPRAALWGRRGRPSAAHEGGGGTAACPGAGCRNTFLAGAAARRPYRVARSREHRMARSAPRYGPGGAHKLWK